MTRIFTSTIAVLTIFSMIIGLAACGKKDDSSIEEKSTTKEMVTAENDVTVTVVAEESTSKVIKGFVHFDFDKVDSDPSKWSMQEIVDCYKSGMAKADGPDAMTDKEFQLIGELPGAASILEKPVQLAMKLGTKPYNAISGGYWDLVPNDLESADAHKDGKYVVINLYPKVQVDGPNGEEHKGTVGHVVNVVQGIDDYIAYIEENYGILNAYYDDDSIVLTYKDSYAKNIRINTETGKMESGTWGYDVYIHLDHCGILGVKFNDFTTAIRWKCWYPVAD